MQNPISLKSAERKVFQTTFADGLWDVFIGCILLELVIAPFLSETMGDFWSSAVFLPFFGLVYLAIWLVRRYVVAPRIGKVVLGKPRLKRLRRFSTMMLIVNVLVFLMGLVVALTFNQIPGFLIAGILGLSILFGFSAAAYFLDYPRLYFYGLLLVFMPPVGEWLYQNHGAVHHGYPIVFGFASGLMILVGLITFVRLLINTPKVDLPEGV